MKRLLCVSALGPFMVVQAIVLISTTPSSKNEEPEFKELDYAGVDAAHIRYGSTPVDLAYTYPDLALTYDSLDYYDEDYRYDYKPAVALGSDYAPLLARNSLAPVGAPQYSSAYSDYPSDYQNDYSIDYPSDYSADYPGYEPAVTPSWALSSYHPVAPQPSATNVWPSKRLPGLRRGVVSADIIMQQNLQMQAKSLDPYEPLTYDRNQPGAQVQFLQRPAAAKFHHNQYEYGYHYQQQKPKRRYKPVHLRLPEKSKKKMKIISVDKGFAIPGGVRVFGKFRSVKGCMKACTSSPVCFAGDFNPWLGTCHMHGNLTACQRMEASKKSVHFKKVPCTVSETPRGQVILGAQLHFALEQKGIDDLATCIEKCASVGSGIPQVRQDRDHQICFGVDYDFALHKCYFHVRNFPPVSRICGGVLRTPRDLVPNPSTVFVQICPPFQ